MDGTRRDTPGGVTPRPSPASPPAHRPPHLRLHLEAAGLRIQRLHQHLQPLLRHGGPEAGGGGGRYPDAPPTPEQPEPPPPQPPDLLPNLSGGGSASLRRLWGRQGPAGLSGAEELPGGSVSPSPPADAAAHAPRRTPPPPRPAGAARLAPAMTPTPPRRPYGSRTTPPPISHPPSTLPERPRRSPSRSCRSAAAPGSGARRRRPGEVLGAPARSSAHRARAQPAPPPF